MNADQKQRATVLVSEWNTLYPEYVGDRMAALLQELIDAPEVEPVAKVTGYYGGHLTISTIDGRVLPAGTALYLAPPAQSVPDAKLVQMMVNRFLCWKLPKDFGPDAGISFKPSMPYETPSCWPVGTNLFTADQAKAMIEHMLDGVTIFVQPQPEPPADLVRDAKPDIWRVMCGDWRDKTVAIHNSAGYITCGLDPAKAAALVRAHNGEMSDGARSNLRSERRQMTRDEIINMAREAGLDVHDRKQQVRIGLDTLVGSDSTDKLIRFAALVAAAEREACAKIAARAAPQPPKLSDERILELSDMHMNMYGFDDVAFARAIEREILGGES